MPPASQRFGIAMIPLAAHPKVSSSAIRADLAETWPDLPRLTQVERTEKDILTFDLGDQVHVFLTLMRSPIPWSDLEGPCATSVLWKDAAEVLRDHQAHLLVTIMFEDELPPIEKSVFLTQVTASVVNTCESALGVYWCNATLVIQPKLFHDFAIRVMPVGPPIHIWVDFRVGPNEQGTTSGFTTGLESLGLMELETENASDPPGELRERFEGLIHYLLENGPVIEDGDTIGEDMSERIRVAYAASAFGHESTVMRLDYEPLGSRG